MNRTVGPNAKEILEQAVELIDVKLLQLDNYLLFSLKKKEIVGVLFNDKIIILFNSFDG